MPHADPLERARYHRAYRSRYLALPENVAKVRAAERARAQRIKDHIDDLKVARGCTDCGFDVHPAALDFDHVTGKKEHLVAHSKSIAQAEREAAKCEVRCSNCHRIRHAAPRHRQRYPRRVTAATP